MLCAERGCETWAPGSERSGRYGMGNTMVTRDIFPSLTPSLDTVGLERESSLRMGAARGETVRKEPRNKPTKP